MTDLDRGLMNVLSLHGNLDTANSMTELQFADGRTVCLPAAMLQDHGTATPVVYNIAARDEAIVVPIVEERLEVSKRTVATGKLRLEKTVQAYDLALDEPLAVIAWKVERVPFNQVVETAPPIRHEGETTVYPLIEERLVLTKELVLVEEIRVSRVHSERRDTQTVTLRREHVSVEREPVAAK